MTESSSPFTNQKAGEAFLINPPGGEKGEGVLVLHSWWGLTDWVKSFCKRLADSGYTALAPDLFHGEKPEQEADAQKKLEEADPDTLSGLVMSSAHTLRAVSKDPNKPIAVVGFSMGGSLALWLSARLSQNVNAVVTFYGAQSIDFDKATASYQGHFAEDDHIVSDDDRIATESFIRLGGKQTEFHLYPQTKHWFFEAGNNFHEQAAELAWERTLQFLNTEREEK